MLLSEETDMNESQMTSVQDSGKTNETKQNSSLKPKPALPKKPDSVTTGSENTGKSANHGISRKGELTVSELCSESDNSEKSQMDKKKLSEQAGLKRSDSKTKDLRGSGDSKSGKKELQTDSNQNITFIQHEEGLSSNKGQSQENSVSKDKSDGTKDQTGGKGRRNRRKQVCIKHVSKKKSDL